MVLLVTTQATATALQALSPSSREKLGLPQTTPEIGAPISHEQLISLSKALRKEDNFDRPAQDARRNTKQEQQQQHAYTLNSLLKGTRVYIPPAPPKPEPSAEYLALKARLQALADEQAYNQLLAPSSSSITKSNHYGPAPIFASPDNQDTRNNLIDGIRAEDDHDPLTPSLVINIFMSILLCGFATFWALKNFQTPSFLGWILLSGHTHTSGSYSQAGTATYATTTSAKDPVFVLISIFVGILVGVAESVVYAAYWRKVRQAKAVEKNMKEKKEVVSTSSLLPDAGSIDLDVKEEVKIWGKGANGGVRRRVRERWENSGTTTTSQDSDSIN